jgi:hypothetical protein
MILYHYRSAWPTGQRLEAMQAPVALARGLQPLREEISLVGAVPGFRKLPVHERNFSAT